MTKLEQDLKLAHELIEDKEKFIEYYWQFYRMWPFTTINMKEYLDPFDLENKKCVTIQGSSDHVFELHLKKAQKIIGVDTNPLTEHYCYLKLAAFAVLDNPEAFLKFFRWNDYPKFCEYNRSVFDKDTFEEISKYLEGDSKLFWEDLFRNYEPIKIRTMLFNKVDEENNRTLYNALNYLTPENYEYIRKTREQINFSFMNSDIKTLANELTENQDFMTLSNLIIYAHDMYPDNPLQGFKGLIEKLSTKLSKNGQIVVGYLYDIEDEEGCLDIYKSALRDAVFTEPEYSYNYFKRIHDLHCDQETESHDACLIYTKK